MTERAEARRRAGMVAPSFNFLMLLLTFALLGLGLRQEWVSGSGAAFVFVFTAWVLSLCLHEFGHAYVAWKGGDDDIPATGYLSLDPRRYADPIFSVVMPLIFTILGGIGFPGGSVLVNRERLGSRVWQSAMSAAGPAMNGLFLLFLLLLYRFSSEEAEALREALAVAAFFQGTAIVLNLMPIPGLDGYAILHPWLPRDIQAVGGRIALHSGLILMGLFVFSNAFGRAVSRAGFAIAAGAGFAPGDIQAGYAAIRLW